MEYSPFTQKGNVRAAGLTRLRAAVMPVFQYSWQGARD